MSINARKAEHLRIAAGPGVKHAGGSGLESVRLRHRALPERDLADVRLDCACSAPGSPLRSSSRP